MEGKLSEEHMKRVLAEWKTSPRVAKFDEQLLGVLELYERFPLDVVVTGGIPEANTKLARAACGLPDEKHWLPDQSEEDEEDEEDSDEDSEEEDEEEDDDDDDDESDETDEDEDQVDAGRATGHRQGKVSWRTEHGLPMVYHPTIPNIRIWVLNEQPAAPSSSSPNPIGFMYDFLVVLTSELHQEDHLGLVMQLRERDQPLYLVRADREMDLLKEELKGPCKTCAWERMKERNLEIQRRRKEREMHGNNQDQDPHNMVEITDIGEVLMSVLPEMRKRAFCQFMADASKELKVPKLLRNNAKSAIIPAMSIGKVAQADLERVSDFLQAKDLASHPSRLLSILNVMETFRLDVGVLGPTGCGSSSLVNTFLGLKPGDNGAAPTGVTETTLGPVAYLYPQLPDVN